MTVKAVKGLTKHGQYNRALTKDLDLCSRTQLLEALMYSQIYCTLLREDLTAYGDIFHDSQGEMNHFTVPRRCLKY